MVHIHMYGTSKWKFVNLVHIHMYGAPALAEIKPVYYLGEEKLVSLDVLKLYWGEDLV